MQWENPTRWTTLWIPIPERAALAYWRRRRISRKTRISEKLPPPLIHKKNSASWYQFQFIPSKRAACYHPKRVILLFPGAKRAFLLSPLLSVLKQIESVASGGRDSDRDGTELLFLLRLVPALVSVCVSLDSISGPAIDGHQAGNLSKARWNGKESDCFIYDASRSDGCPLTTLRAPFVCRV